MCCDSVWWDKDIIDNDPFIQAWDDNSDYDDTQWYCSEDEV